MTTRLQPVSRATASTQSPTAPSRTSSSTSSPAAAGPTSRRSRAAARALALARALFPAAEAALFSAFDLPYIGLHDGDPAASLDDARQRALASAREFLEARGHAGLAVTVAHGDAARQLGAHAIAVGADLVVAATHGRSALYHLLIGSVARAILDASPCDTLLVPEPKARGDEGRPAP